jgi:hypothetical protein
MANPRGPLCGVATNNPFTGAFSITPANADLTEIPRALWVDVAGTLVITFADGSGPFTINVPARVELRFMALRIASASTATGILGLR